jgi:hypothetical protein
MPYEASALLRTMCEPLYIIKILEDDPEFNKQFIKYSAHNALKSMNVALNETHPVFDKTKEYITDDMIRELEESTAGFNHHAFKAANLAQKAGLMHHYNTTFRVSSTDVHASPVVMFRYLKKNSNGDIQGLDWGPSEKNFDLIVMSSTSTLLQASEIMDRIFNVEADDEYKIIKAKWLALNKMSEES